MSTSIALETLDVTDTKAWRSWLRKNHLTKPGVMLVFHKGGEPSMTYDDALDEALAYGWIDSVLRRIDDKRYVRKFSPRRPGSVWSSLNIDRVDRLRSAGQMTEWGEAAFGKRTPEISMLEKVNSDGAKIPRDFEAALRKNKKAWDNFERMPPSHRRRYLVWLAGAKRPGMRKKRVVQAVELIAQNVKNLMK